MHRHAGFRHGAGIRRRQPGQRRHNEQTTDGGKGKPLFTPVEGATHQPDRHGATGNPQPDAAEMNTQFRPMIVTNQPVEDEPGAEQHAGRAGQAGDETRRHPDQRISRQAHHQGAQDGDHEANPVELVLEHEIADQRGNQRATQVAGVVERRHPAGFGQSESGLLLHQRQQRRVGKTGDTKGQQQAKNPGAQHLEAFSLRVHGAAFRD